MAVSPIAHACSSHLHLYALLAGGLLLVHIVLRIHKIYTSHRPYPGVLLVSLPGKTPKDSWIQHGNETLQLGLQTTPDAQPFQVMTGTGPKIVLRNRYADEVAQHKHLSFSANLLVDFMAGYPGFEGVQVGLQSTLTRDTVVKKLTQSLGLVTADVVEEATDSIEDSFGASPEWKTVEIQAEVQQMVARLSSRVFLGKPLCRDQRWLDIAKDYTVHIFEASRDLRAVSSLIRPVKHWFVPSCRALRKDVKDARALIGGEVARRDAAAKALLAQGKKAAKKADATAWFVEMAQEQGRELSVVDLVSYQLGLTMAAIHTTTDATCQALRHLCEHPECVPPLRDEIIRIVGEHGWAKTSLYQLRLMDSFLKESQRHSRGPSTLHRLATADILLSDGYTIKKGTRTILLAGFMDEDFHPDPLHFDAARFLDRRHPAGPTTHHHHHHQYVTTSPSHTGFGHGLHACPGRFFVANELKIALSHLLLKYDWSSPDATRGTAETWEIESAPIWNPREKLSFKRRREEVDLGLVTG